MLLKNKNVILFSLSLLSSMAFAGKAELSEQHIVAVPQCLIKNSNIKFKTLATTSALALIEVNDDGIDQLIESKTQRRVAHCGGFMEVTEDWNAYHAKNISVANHAKSFLAQYAAPTKLSFAKSNIDYSIKYEKQVNPLLNQLNPQKMWTNLTTLTSFKDRHAKSDDGVKAAEWIKAQVETMAKNFNRNDVTVYYIPTGEKYKQSSVIAKLGKGSEPGIVIGAHMDTEASKSSPKPGADDDGTGTVTVLEVARTLFASGAQFKKPIYFIWYAAEEPGLVGSGYVVAEFEKKNIPIAAVIQLDMTGYAYKNDPSIWLIDDYVDKNLNAYLETLVNTYVKQPVKYTTCGYDCSDHASWYLKGIPATSPFEAQVGNDNPNIHTSKDTMDLLSPNHMMDFAKLTLAFAVELGEPVSK